jgi:hypothetical protein
MSPLRALLFVVAALGLLLGLLPAAGTAGAASA